MKRCPNRHITTGFNFCTECGEPMVEIKQSCPKCGESIVETQRFCGECGSKLDSESGHFTESTP
jgi:predicted amidophosphoribosyltransferase